MSRNTYLRMGVVEWQTKSAAHLVLYFRWASCAIGGQLCTCNKGNKFGALLQVRFALAIRAKLHVQLGLPCVDKRPDSGRGSWLASMAVPPGGASRWAKP